MPSEDEYQQDALPSTETHSAADVEMNDDSSVPTAASGNAGQDLPRENPQATEPRNLPPNQDVPGSLVEENDSIMHPSMLVGRVLKFVMGFCTGTPTKRAFIEAGGVERLLDLVTSPSLGSLAAKDRVSATDNTDVVISCGRVMQVLIEEQPYLVLPSVIHRLERAIAVLDPLTNNASATPFFEAFTKLPADPNHGSHVAGSPSAELDKGTAYAQALVMVNVLSHVLSEYFQSPSFNSRSPASTFQHTNLADKYVELVAKLGKIGRSCVWEHVQLMENMSPAWKEHTLILEKADADVLDPASPERMIKELGYPLPSNDDGGSKTELDDKERRTAQFNNSKILRYLLCKTYSTIEIFTQHLGRILLIRKTSDPYQKQLAVSVADQIAVSITEQLAFKPPMPHENLQARFAYWTVILSQMHQTHIYSKIQRPRPVVVLILNRQGITNPDSSPALLHESTGLLELETILSHLIDEAEKEAADTTPALKQYAYAGIRSILNFYTRIVDAKPLIEAPRVSGSGFQVKRAGKVGLLQSKSVRG